MQIPLGRQCKQNAFANMWLARLHTFASVDSMSCVTLQVPPLENGHAGSIDVPLHGTCCLKHTGHEIQTSDSQRKNK